MSRKKKSILLISEMALKLICLFTPTLYIVIDGFMFQSDYHTVKTIHLLHMMKFITRVLVIVLLINISDKIIQVKFKYL